MRLRSVLLVTLATFLLAGVAVAAVPGPKRGSKYHKPTSGSLGVVATESPAASRVGRAVLESGGNAVDAAASIIFALNTARPQSCGVGGGGFLVYRSAAGKRAALDFREEAPAKYTHKTLAGDGPHTTFTGHLTTGAPGVVAGMDAALRRYGTISLGQAVAPAEDLARNGVRVTPALAAALKDPVNAKRSAPFTAMRKIFYPGGTPLKAGALLKNPDLAATLDRIRTGGRAGFYSGTTAQLIAADMAKSTDSKVDEHGLLTAADLAHYKAVWRTPVVGGFRGDTIIGMGPPSSGGVAIQEMLNLLAPYPLKRWGRGSANTLHVVAEAQKIAFADRAKYLADSDFVKVPVKRLISKAYAAKRRKQISLTKARTPKPGVFKRNETGATTHVSVIDKRGNSVAVTCTIEQELGSTVVAPGTGLLLNNEMTDFGDPGTANQPQAFKRPRSSISPTIAVQGGKPVAVTGAAGGSRIIMGTFWTLLDRVAYGLPLASAVDAPRLDAQLELATSGEDHGKLFIENGRISKAALRSLVRRGHKLKKLGSYDDKPRVQAAGYRSPKTKVKDAVSDPRTEQASLKQRK